MSHRNIIFKGSHYAVKVYRQGKCEYRSCRTLKEAKLVRFELESELPPSRPWDNTEKKANPRTTKFIREERKRRGLCPFCGSPSDRLPVLTCSECAEVIKMKGKMEE